jgi:hypothetical protein
LSTKDGMVIFKPAGTNYQMHLAAGKYTGPLDQPISAVVRVTARKVYTVPSGGNFVAPIFGQPRILQGRVLSVEDRAMVIHAGLPVVVDLPSSDTAIDLDNGQITVGMMVNVVAMPQARFTLAGAADPVGQTAH